MSVNYKYEANGHRVQEATASGSNVVFSEIKDGRLSVGVPTENTAMRDLGESNTGGGTLCEGDIAIIQEVVFDADNYRWVVGAVDKTHNCATLVEALALVANAAMEGKTASLTRVETGGNA